MESISSKCFGLFLSLSELVVEEILLIECGGDG